MTIPKTPATAFHDYQEKDIASIFDTIQSNPKLKMVYQLPTGGGKTLVFSEIARRFIAQYGTTVMILTHRKELSRQTSITLKKIGVQNRIINSTSGHFKPGHKCYVAMVETLRNRIKAKKIATQDIGLLMIDEAHHNSFRKLLRHFKNAFVIGVTATPFSADSAKPMKRYYDKLIIGEPIAALIANGFLAQPSFFVHDVELNTLKTGIHGDYTVHSSNELYGSPAMLDLLLSTYKAHAAGKKTLIFNNGIEASTKVFDAFTAADIAIKHLDNKTSDSERKEILKWFKRTKDAVLTSVSILTTGFDEPTIERIILNRATTSITLYHQMVGRGSRRLPSKKSFSVIDLGNNIQRFGEWQEAVDWQLAFDNPEAFAKQLQHSNGGSSVQTHAVAPELRAQFPNTLEMTFDIEAMYQEAIDTDKKPKTVIQQSIRQHTKMCLDNAETLTEAITLARVLEPEIEWRVKLYVKCLGNASKNYRAWLIEDYQNRLEGLIKKLYAKLHVLE